MDSKCIEPVRAEQISDERLNVPSKLITRERKAAQNEFLKHKARLVARGDTRREEPEEIGNTYSPTASYPSILFLLEVILARRLCWMTGEFTTAYLNSKFRAIPEARNRSHCNYG